MDWGIDRWVVIPAQPGIPPFMLRSLSVTLSQGFVRSGASPRPSLRSVGGGRVTFSCFAKRK